MRCFHKDKTLNAKNELMRTLTAVSWYEQMDIFDWLVKSKITFAVKRTYF